MVLEIVKLKNEMKELDTKLKETAVDNKQNKQSALNPPLKETETVKSILLPKTKKEQLQSNQTPDQEETQIQKRPRRTKT